VVYLLSSLSGFGVGEVADAGCVWDCSSLSGLGVMDDWVDCWDSGLGWED